MYKSFHILNKFFQVFFDAFAGDVWPEERQITNDGQLGRGSWQKVSPISYKLPTKGWLAIAKLKPLSLFISILLMLKKALDNVKIEK